MKKAMIVLACLAGVIMVQGLALAAAAKEQSRKSIVQLMRENGFNHKSASWTSESVTVDENKKTTNSSGKVWLSGDKYRMETKDQQGKKMIMLDDGKDLYMISVDEKKAYTGAALDSMFGGVLASEGVGLDRRRLPHQVRGQDAQAQDEDRLHEHGCSGFRDHQPGQGPGA